MSITQDRQEIADLLLRYTGALDRSEWDAVRTVFTDEPDIDFGPMGSWKGADAVGGFIDTFSGLLEQTGTKPGHILHRTSNQTITLAGDDAEVRTYLDALLLTGFNEAGLQAIGYYDDHLVRTAAGWRVDRRRFTIVRMGPIGAVQDGP
ncbi:MAG: nuclear transport factor 2 family protein [Pseudonocardia sp.]|nr:nuclear transport factor 2 family protein [Pseudonocardia sp.]